MKNARSHLQAILARIRKKGCVLMLDFDGVLAPIVPLPDAVTIPRRTSVVLAACVARMPVAIITGRALADIMRRVGVPGMMYGGNHGMEWKINGRVKRRGIPIASLAGFRAARRALCAVASNFPGTMTEDKRNCLAVHYRGLARRDEIRFVHAAEAAAAPFARAGAIRVINNLYTFEVMPRAQWTKGDCALLIWHSARNGTTPVPIYIGDGLTDEDAFIALRKNGITIRVGKTRESAAQYYFASREEVDGFLSALAGLPDEAHTTPTATKEKARQ